MEWMAYRRRGRYADNVQMKRWEVMEDLCLLTSDGMDPCMVCERVFVCSSCGCSADPI